MNSAPVSTWGAKRMAPIGAFAWLLFASVAPGAQSVQPLRADGIEIFHGVIPAEIILGHPEGHSERKMHGGSPAWGEQYHLIVTLFDSVSKERIQDAEVKATVFDTRQPGKRLAGQQKRLEPMLFADAASYGNYFNLPGPAPYRIELEIRRRGAVKTVKVPLEYRHGVAPAEPRQKE